MLRLCLVGGPDNNDVVVLTEWKDSTHGLPPAEWRLVHPRASACQQVAGLAWLGQGMGWESLGSSGRWSSSF